MAVVYLDENEEETDILSFTSSDAAHLLDTVTTPSQRFAGAAAACATSSTSSPPTPSFSESTSLRQPTPPSDANTQATPQPLPGCAAAQPAAGDDATTASARSSCRVSSDATADVVRDVTPCSSSSSITTNPSARPPVADAQPATPPPASPDVEGAAAAQPLPRPTPSTGSSNTTQGLEARELEISSGVCSVDAVEAVESQLGHPLGDAPSGGGVEGREGEEVEEEEGVSAAKGDGGNVTTCSSFSGTPSRLSASTVAQAGGGGGGQELFRDGFSEFQQRYAAGGGGAAAADTARISSVRSMFEYQRIVSGRGGEGGGGSSTATAPPHLRIPSGEIPALTKESPREMKGKAASAVQQGGGAAPLPAAGGGKVEEEEEGRDEMYRRDCDASPEIPEVMDFETEGSVSGDEGTPGSTASDGVEEMIDGEVDGGGDDDDDDAGLGCGSRDMPKDTTFPPDSAEGLPMSPSLLRAVGGGGGSREEGGGGGGRGTAAAPPASSAGEGDNVTTIALSAQIADSYTETVIDTYSDYSEMRAGEAGEEDIGDPSEATNDGDGDDDDGGDDIIRGDVPTATTTPISTNVCETIPSIYDVFGPDPEVPSLPPSATPMGGGGVPRRGGGVQPARRDVVLVSNRRVCRPSDRLLRHILQPRMEVPWNGAKSVSLRVEVVQRGREKEREEARRAEEEERRQQQKAVQAQREQRRRRRRVQQMEYDRQASLRKRIEASEYFSGAELVPEPPVSPRPQAECLSPYRPHPPESHVTVIPQSSSKKPFIPALYRRRQLKQLPISGWH